MKFLGRVVGKTWSAQQQKGGRDTGISILLPVTDPPRRHPNRVKQVEWTTLQQEEVAALVDWSLQMPRDWPLTPQFKDRVLQAVSAQVSGHHQRCALLWFFRVIFGSTRVGFGRLPPIRSTQ
jgi:hypothetical protein